MARTYELSNDGVVVVIGSGAGGGTLANELAQKGIDVVCLEAGARLGPADIVTDEAVMEGRIGWHDRRDGPPVWLCKTVGGTTVRWSGMTPRLMEHEFRARTIYGALENASLIDWPLTLAELAPYYDKAERKMGVAGAHGVPPFPETNNFKVLKAGAQRLGYTQIDTRSVAINSVARDGRPGCQFLGFCHSGCASQAKWSTLYTEIAKAEDTEHFELRPQCMAVRIEHDDRGRVTSVVYRDAQGTTHAQKARAVAVAGNAIETTRLLLMSNSTQFPQGLANSAGHLGRNYMRHTTAFVHALMPGPVNYHRAPRQAGMVRDEHRHDPARGFAGGYLLQTAAFPPGNIAAEISGWGEDAARIMENYTHFAGMFIVGEDPPQAKNGITLHPTDVDENRLPVPVIAYEDHRTPSRCAGTRSGRARRSTSRSGRRGSRARTGWGSPATTWERRA